MKTINNRTTQYEIENIFLERYSPRAMSGENISEDQLMTLFEAARFAPSSLNIQPWRFIYATREMPEFQNFLSFLTELNLANLLFKKGDLEGLEPKNKN